MAEVTLRSDSGRSITDLPPVCMKCGGPAAARPSKTFSWTPQWINGSAIVPLVYIILALVLTKHQRVETPLCDRHKSYWWLFPALGVGSFVLGLAGVIALAVLLESMPRGVRGALPTLVGVTGVVLLIVWTIVLAVVQNYRIKPNEITGRSIRLTNVAPEFVDAVEAEEEAYHRGEDAYDLREPRRFRDDQPRRPRAPIDDDRYREGDDERRYQR